MILDLLKNLNVRLQGSLAFLADQIWSNQEIQLARRLLCKSYRKRGAHIKFIKAVEGAADLLAHSHDEAHVGEATLSPAQALHVCDSLLLVLACLHLHRIHFWTLTQRKSTSWRPSSQCHLLLKRMAYARMSHCQILVNVMKWLPKCPREVLS